MLTWLNDLPTAKAALVICSICVGGTFAGILFLRPVIRAVVGRQPNINGIVGSFLGAFGVIYGILLGLLAVAAYENETTVKGMIDTESTALFALYRNAAAFPEPTRGELRRAISGYADAVVEEEWPEMRRGDVAMAAMPYADAAQAALAAFQPAGPGEEILLGEVSGRFYDFLQLRGERASSALQRIPGIMWMAVLLGALINVVMFWMFDMKLAVQLLLAGLFAFYLGVVISLIVVLDSPLRGDYGVEPQPFEMLQLHIERTVGE